MAREQVSKPADGAQRKHGGGARETAGPDRAALQKAAAVQRLRPGAAGVQRAALLGRLSGAAGNRAMQRAIAGPLQRQPDPLQRAGDPTTIAANMLQFVDQDHPDWDVILDGIGAEMDDATKMARLIANFQTNAMGWTYTGPAGLYSLNGDCGQLVRTFSDIANNVLLVGGVATAFHNGGNGWYLPGTVDQIDTGRAQNLEGGGWYFKSSHVWATWNGTVYDVLFGEVGQNGREADEHRTAQIEGRSVWHVRIGAQWYRSNGDNTYSQADPPP